MDLRGCVRNTDYGVKFRISELPQAPSRRPASAELVKLVRPVSNTGDKMSFVRTTHSINLVSRSMVFPMFRSKIVGSCCPRISLFLCVVMLRLTLGASENVGEPIGRNSEKTSQNFAARKEHMKVALGSADLLSVGSLPTDKTRKVETVPKGLLKSELVRVKDQQLQLKAGIVKKENLVREFTDKVFLLEQGISQLGHELQKDRVLVSELEKSINSIQARICDGSCTVNRFDENNESLTDINLLPADVFKWPAMLEDSFVREPTKWVPVPESLPQVRTRLDQLTSRLMKMLLIQKEGQKSQSRTLGQPNEELDVTVEMHHPNPESVDGKKQSATPESSQGVYWFRSQCCVCWRLWLNGILFRLLGQCSLQRFVE